MELNRAFNRAWHAGKSMSFETSIQKVTVAFHASIRILGMSSVDHSTCGCKTCISLIGTKHMCVLNLYIHHISTANLLKLSQMNSEHLSDSIIYLHDSDQYRLDQIMLPYYSRCNEKSNICILVHYSLICTVYDIFKIAYFFQMLSS